MMASSAACCLFSATWAAMTRCRSAIKLHLAHRQSLNLQCLLCPFSQEIMPWFRHRAHLGFRAPFSVRGPRSSESVRMSIRSMSWWWFINDFVSLSMGWGGGGWWGDRKMSKTSHDEESVISRWPFQSEFCKVTSRDWRTSF